MVIIHDKVSEIIISNLAQPLVDCKSESKWDTLRHKSHLCNKKKEPNGDRLGKNGIFY